MNREQRRKLKKVKSKADEIWKLEMLATLAKDSEVKNTAEREIARIASTCTLEQLLLIDEYLMEQYGAKT